ncbi:Uncharacterized protein PECH_002058 [Penicillium ucsense]|uniref:Jacalin-type lectin domain-containing protein n=1 Tax=Penicillium ucsense TaxID=2839758 RepID=A0A8J8W7D7_9EURO|nr:Uncharacterized protein PECM_002621 [Penicillium ucsense]KAF7738020.1 Uncharacterized protein PECH_002058 [Penicillium ucsense]
MTKRSIETDSTADRRVKPMFTDQRLFKVTNVDDGETVHQTCLLIHGECQSFDPDDETDYVSASSSNMPIQSNVTQHWPCNAGKWSALVMLSPGKNSLVFNLYRYQKICGSAEISVNYVPLLQLPPLHLAILVAKDSPLLIDCPPVKYGSISTAHSGLDAAIAKFRMSAYMWQALTAEDLRQKDLGRRSFRLDEEWTSNSSLRKSYQRAPGDARQMGAVAKVHIVRSDKTVAQLRDANVAQQNSRGSDCDVLHRYFEDALRDSGAPFDSASRPVVAGLILDSHYSNEQSLITGHAALGCHKPNGISLGIFGSHLTYAWPRFLEEVPACLTDLTAPGETVGNDNGECDTLRGACFVGQGAFLHEVGHAFGAEHTTGIMARGYSKTWGVNFIQHADNPKLENAAKWDLQDALKFKMMPHFALPHDAPVTQQFREAQVQMEVILTKKVASDPESTCEGLKITCSAGLARIEIASDSPHDDAVHQFINKSNHTEFQLVDIRNKYNQAYPLRIVALGMNGKRRVVANVWAMLKDIPFISIPGSDLVLEKKSVRCQDLDSTLEDTEVCKWAMLLHRRGKDGQLHRATSIDLRVGCTMDGAVVYYADGKHANCGPARNSDGTTHRFGGHASEDHRIPAGETISQIRICKRADGWGGLSGIRMTLSNGDSWGYLNDNPYGDDEDEQDNQSDAQEEEDENIVTLEPADGEVIVGFYGTSDRQSGFTQEFGILTAPRDIELPAQVYDMAELRNDE